MYVTRRIHKNRVEPLNSRVQIGSTKPIKEESKGNQEDMYVGIHASYVPDTSSKLPDRFKHKQFEVRNLLVYSYVLLHMSAKAKRPKASSVRT
jgi:hypothetical protein